ncbi:unnamed protein product, partial [Urochloa humidicola]
WIAAQEQGQASLPALVGGVSPRQAPGGGSHSAHSGRAQLLVRSPAHVLAPLPTHLCPYDGLQPLIATRSRLTVTTRRQVAEAVEQLNLVCPSS